MRYLAIALAALATVTPVSGNLSEGERAVADARATDALIVREAALTREGVGKLSAIRVADPEKLSALEAFFPGYSKRPSSHLAGGWKAGYQVYFNFPRGETVRVTVSENQNGHLWSAGQGDFATRGNFVGFVEGLVR
jgi:hypothetical protein